LGLRLGLELEISVRVSVIIGTELGFDTYGYRIMVIEPIAYIIKLIYCD